MSKLYVFRRVSLRGRFAVVGVMLLSLVAVACGSSASGGGSTSGGGGTIKLGLLGTSTGPVAVSCFDANRGAELALSEAKGMKGYLGDVDVQLVSEDDKGTAQGATTGYRALQDADVLAFVGPCNSTAEAALVPVIDKGGVPQVISYASDKPDVEPKLAFRGSSPAPYFKDGVMPVLQKRGVKTIFIAGDFTNASIVNNVASLEKSAKALGIEVVGTYKVNGTSQIDFSSAIEQAKKLNPDAIGIYTGGGQPALMVKAFRAAGLKQPFFGGPTLYRDEILKNAAAAGSVFQVAYTDQLTDPASVRFAKLYKEKFPDNIPTPISAGGYDAMWRVLRAIHDAGPAKVAGESLDEARAAVVGELDAQKTADGAQGRLQFLPNGDTTTDPIVVEADGHGGVKILDAPAAS